MFHVSTTATINKISVEDKKKKNGNTYCREELVLAQVWESVLENKRKLDIKGD